MIYENAAEQIITKAVDDFRHGMLDGERMTRQAAVSIVGSIVNSPGAGLKAAMGTFRR
jgi:hypothetical protein